MSRRPLSRPARIAIALVGSIALGGSVIGNAAAQSVPGASIGSDGSGDSAGSGDQGGSSGSLGSTELSDSVSGSLFSPTEFDPNLEIGEDPTRGPLPVPFNISAGVSAMISPHTPPPGANDWNCKPGPEHPRPVVLVNPTFTTQALAFQAGSPLLKNAGYCVFTFNYGNIAPVSGSMFQALDDIPAGAEVLSDTVDKVLETTGADQVDLVGHSQGGGIMPDYYLKVLGGAEKVHTKVGISPSTGTTLSEFAFLRSLLPVLGPLVFGSLGGSAAGLTDQVLDSEIAKQVYPDGTTAAPGVETTAIVTRYDWVVTPYDRQFYVEADNVTNIDLQEGCAEDMSEHVSTLYSERAWRNVLNALDPEHAEAVPCMPVAPFAPWVR